MNTEYTFKTSSLFAQAYGTDSYGGQTYSYCQQTPEGCVGITEGAPNTGFLGLSQDAALASASGALLIAIAIAGAVFMIVSRRRRALKKNIQE
jgi:hypothetical protein